MRRIVVALTLSLSILASCTTHTPAAADPATPSSTPAALTTDPCAPRDRPCWEAHKRRQADERAWWAEVRRQQVERARIHRLFAFAYAVEQARLASAHAAEIGNGGRLVQGIPVCGSWFPCYIVARESGFNPTARNPRSSAGGLYQFLRFWLPYCGLSGYSNFAQVPVIDQVRCAKKVVRQHGLAPWRLTR